MKKKLLLVIFLVMPFYLMAGFNFLDKKSYLVPIKYNGDIIVRSDGWGEGYFAANRSGGRQHEGLDLLAKVGSPVLASRSGKVLAARQSRGMGKYIILEHSGSITTLYGHLSKIYVKRGQFVKQGELIGKVGKTGNARRRSILSHLHFEIRKDRTPLDPLRFI